VAALLDMLGSGRAKAPLRDAERRFIEQSEEAAHGVVALPGTGSTSP